AVGLSMLAVGLALGADDAAAGRSSGDEASTPPDRAARRAFLSGLLVGLASTARLTVILATPFFLIVGPRIGWRRRVASVLLGAAIPVVALLAYNVVSTGHVFHPAYDHLYQLEARAYTGLGYHPDWAAEDPRYVPQNLAIM